MTAKPRTPDFYQPGIDRLYAMVRALQAPEPLDAQLRAEIALALGSLILFMEREDARHTPGNRDSEAPFLLAYTIDVLVRKLGYTVKAAAAAASGPRASVQDVETAQRHYRTFKRAGYFEAEAEPKRI